MTTVTIPLVRARLPMVRVDVARVGAPATAQARAAARAVGSYLPAADQLAYYAGVTGLAVIGVLEWPVAAVAGLGVLVASRGRRQSGAPASGSGAG
jgi:hypothetical protein